MEWQYGDDFSFPYQVDHLSACYDRYAAWDFYCGLDQFQKTDFYPLRFLDHDSFSNCTLLPEGFNSGGFDEKQQQQMATTFDFEKKEMLVENESNKLTREMLSKYFYMPISEAAREMKVGLTYLKKRCRELGIRRWPHRKLMSLQTLINNVKEMGPKEEGDEKTREALQILEQEKRLVEEVPDIELDKSTKRLRQAYFKVNYKKKRVERNVPQLIASTVNVDHNIQDRRGFKQENAEDHEFESLLSNLAFSPDSWDIMF